MGVLRLLKFAVVGGALALAISAPAMAETDGGSSADMLTSGPSGNYYFVPHPDGTATLYASEALSEDVVFGTYSLVMTMVSFTSGNYDFLPSPDGTATYYASEASSEGDIFWTFSFPVQPVPLPAGALLFASALGAIAVFGAVRRRS